MWETWVQSLGWEDTLEKAMTIHFSILAWRISWIFPYGRKRRTKESLNEKGEWKSWRKAQHSESEDHGIWSHHFMANRWGNSANSDRLIFFWAPKSLQIVTAATKLKDSCSLEEKLWQPRQHIKKETYFANKCPSCQGYGFSSGHVWIWELDYEESWTLNNWCFWTVMLEKTLESPLDCKENHPVNTKGNQS